MNCQIRLLIYKRKFIYDDVIISSKGLCKTLICINQKIESEELSKISDDFTEQKIKFYPLLLREKGINAYLVSAYVYTMNRSDIYKKAAVDTLECFIKTKITKYNTVNPVILIKLNTPKYQFLDYGWNERLTKMVMERQEIDHAMSWLSTLGGAFSALGDQFDHCAKVAGKISLEQFKLSMRLGDPQLVARCRLYASLSLLQQGYLKACRNMVIEIFNFAVKDKDIRLQRMCQGVWAKLKYCYSIRKNRLRQLCNNSSCS